MKVFETSVKFSAIIERKYIIKFIDFPNFTNMIL